MATNGGAGGSVLLPGGVGDMLTAMTGVPVLVTMAALVVAAAPVTIGVVTISVAGGLNMPSGMDDILMAMPGVVPVNIVAPVVPPQRWASAWWPSAW